MTAPLIHLTGKLVDLGEVDDAPGFMIVNDDGFCVALSGLTAEQRDALIPYRGKVIVIEVKAHE